MDETLARLCRLTALLRSTPAGLTVAEIAHTLDLSRPRVLADLELLSLELNLACDGEEEDAPWRLGGGPVPLPLTLTETLSLLTALAGERDGRLGSIRSRLVEALSSGTADTAVIMRRERILTKGARPFYDSPATERRVAELEEAVLNERRLRMVYRGRDGAEGECVVEPYGLVYYWVWGVWYLAGRCDGRMGVWRADRIVGIGDAGAFVYPRDFSLCDYFADAWGVELDGPVVEVRVRFYDEFNVIKRMRRETEHRRHRKLTEEDGAVVYEDRVRGLTEIKPWLRGFGSSAVVLAPEELREDMIRGARLVAGLDDCSHGNR